MNKNKKRKNLTKIFFIILAFSLLGIVFSSPSKEYIKNEEFEIQISSPGIDLLDRGSAFSGISPLEVIPTVSNFTVWADIWNSGSDPSGDFNVSFRASDNGNISPSDTEIGKVTVSSINAGDNATISYTGIFPEITFVTFGQPIDYSFIIGFIVDVDDDVVEDNEPNNWGFLNYVGSDSVYVANKSDLRDRGPSYSGMSETTVAPGATAFSVFTDIENRGLKEAEGCNVSFYASLDTNITTSDYYLGYDALLPLSNGTFVDVSWAGTFPNITEGVYYIGWIIDVNDDVDEGHEGNNQAYILTQLIVKTPTVSGGIPGYEPLLIISMLSIVSVVYILNKRKKK